MLFRPACLLAALILTLSPAARAQTSGCTDPLAVNYNAAASQNDGSCQYPATSLTATTLAQLSDTIRESSGLVHWEGAFWTHNDDSDTTLYAIDTADGHILKRVRIAGAPNRDWEEITQDADYFYLGDFGNNVDGNRQDLVILRIAKSVLLAGQTTGTPDKIRFSYSDQSSFAPTGNNNTDFDCEAFIATADSLYLFTKQWLGGKTRMYALPKTPGTYVASPRGNLDVDGLVTGATYLPGRRTIALSGYRISGLTFQPFVYLLYDYSGTSFFGGNRRKILVDPSFHQIEAITTIDGQRFFLTNELFSQSFFNVPAKLRRLDLSPYLSGWYASLGVVPAGRSTDAPSLFPNPARSRFDVRIVARRPGPLDATIFESSGKAVLRQRFGLSAGANRISMEAPACAPGLYYVHLCWEEQAAWSKIRLY